MKNWLIGALAVAVLATSVPMDVQAKRLGGGKAAGVQRNMPARTAPDAPPAKPATPAQGQQATPANAAAATPAAAGAAAAAPKRSWMGPIAGLAAGLGLAALMSHLGMGEGFANFLMIALLAAAAFFLIRFLMRRFAGGGMARSPALAGAGAGAGGAPAAWSPVQRVDPPALTDTVAQRSTLDSAPAFGGAATGDATAADTAVTRAFVPAAFDSEGFARTAKMIFIRLQTAHDTADLDDLKRFTTPELFASLRLDIQERGTAPQHTDVLKVEAEVLDVANEADRQVVSVRFHGQAVEEKGAAPTDFNEVWHLVKPHDDSRSWAIAGIEQMS
ncbi:MAG: Tim44 domain-containing protein [Betaproteobacteria bacterium]|nr:Tim44 domain-containing protein [Betaproteobacteria bacterium]